MARYATRFEDEVAARLARDLVAIGVDHAVHQPLCSLYNGLLGALLASRYVEAELAIEPTSERLRDEALSLAADALRNSVLARHFDLLDGCVGVGVYGLELRNDTGRQVASMAVAALARGAQERRGGLTWPTEARFMLPQAREVFGHGCYNIGLAHGIPGAIAFLSIAGLSEVQTSVCADLVQGACNWLLAHADPHGLSMYPHSVGFDAREHRPSRLSWCYGDLSVAVSLAWAAELLGDHRVRRLAHDVAIAAASRMDGTAGIYDNSLCHGAAGAAYLFRWLSSRLGAPALMDASRFWLRTSRTLLLRADDEGSSAGLLQGSSGLGLVHLDIEDPGGHRWPRLLLL